MSVIRQIEFDSANIETFNIAADDLGVRGMELIVTTNNSGIIRVDETVSVATGRVVDFSGTGGAAFQATHLRLAVTGSNVRVVFSSALLHRGRIVLHDQPLAESGRVLIFQSGSVVLAAGAVNQIQMVQRDLGRISELFLMFHCTRAGRIRVFSFYGGASCDNNFFSVVAGATGGYNVVGPFAPPTQLELYYTNDDGAIANTMSCALVGVL
jgi:hypothetical protein